MIKHCDSQYIFNYDKILSIRFDVGKDTFLPDRHHLNQKIIFNYMSNKIISELTESKESCLDNDTGSKRVAKYT